MLYLDGRKLNPQRFGDNSLKLVANPDWHRFYHTITWIYENDAELFELVCVARHLQESGYGNNMQLVMPYIPHARMDRTDRTEYKSFVFTLKYFTEIINGIGFSKVTVYDPHSDVSSGFIHNANVVQPFIMINSVSKSIGKEDLVFYFPDEGAMKRYSSMVEDGNPIVFGDKDRNFFTREIKRMRTYGDTEAINGHNVLMIDDICSSGETLLRSAENLKELGAKDIYIYVSHCENSVPQSNLLRSGLITKLYTTDSLFTGESSLIEVYRIWTEGGLA